MNLNALYKYRTDILIWKYNLFLNELYNIFKKEEEMKKKMDKGKNDKIGGSEEKREEKFEESKFRIIKEQILLSNHFWEAISLSIKFCIENKINSIYILDEYKEEIDPKFSHFKEIKNLINNEKNIYVKLIVASSTNNLDIREFIIKKYIQKI